MKFLVVGLGNIGEEYEHTRHNIGFDVLEILAEKKGVDFSLERHAERAVVKHKGRVLVLIKPTTYMNLSGKAARYWLEKEGIPKENLIVIVDDLALPFGVLRLRAKGGAGGHNGLTNIEQTIGGGNYARLRFGIGADFKRGSQVDHVLSKWSEEEIELLSDRIGQAIEIIEAFVTIGVSSAMSQYNNK